MRVRATRDGTYNGYYREGPVNEIPGIAQGTPGEVFDIDDKPIAATDPETGKPIMEPVLDSLGNPVIDTVMLPAVDEKGNPILRSDDKPKMMPVQRPRMRQKYYSWFNPEWMEKVPDTTPITFEENILPRGVHSSMRIKKQPNRQPKSISEFDQEIGKPIAEEPVTI